MVGDPKLVHNLRLGKRQRTIPGGLGMRAPRVKFYYDDIFPKKIFFFVEIKLPVESEQMNRKALIRLIDGIKKPENPKINTKKPNSAKSKSSLKDKLKKFIKTNNFLYRMLRIKNH